MRTSIANIYAAGDVVLAAHRIADRPVRVEHWQDAMTHGRIAGANAAGESRSWSEVPGFWTTIGTHTLKYLAWGDGYGRARLVEKENGFTVWYETNGIAVGVLTSEVDCEIQRGASANPCGGSDSVVKSPLTRCHARMAHTRIAMAAATKTTTMTPTAIIAAIPVKGNRLTVEGSGSDNPEVWGASGGVLPGATPPPGSRSGVLSGFGSGGGEVTAWLSFEGFATGRYQRVPCCPLNAWRSYPIRELLLITV